MTFGDIRSILMQALYFVLTRFAAPIYWAPATFGKLAVERVGLFRQPFLGMVQKGNFKRICNGKVHSLDVRQSFPSKEFLLAWTGRVANIKEDKQCVMEDSLCYRWRVAWHQILAGRRTRRWNFLQNGIRSRRSMEW